MARGEKGGYVVVTHLAKLNKKYIYEKKMGSGKMIKHYRGKKILHSKKKGKKKEKKNKKELRAQKSC